MHNQVSPYGVAFPYVNHSTEVCEVFYWAHFCEEDAEKYDNAKEK